MADTAKTSQLPYESAAANDYEWTQKAFDMLVSGALAASVTTQSGIQTASVSGSCPRCGHKFIFRQVLDAVSGESTEMFVRQAMRTQPSYVELTVPCCCAEPHAGRPGQDGHGCGINFRVDVRPGA